MYYIIGNVYKKEGFTWVEHENEINYTELWKYSRHGEFETLEQAEKESERLNKLYE